MPQAGQAWIQVNPSLRGFHRKIRAELQRELQGINAEVPVGADTSEARREIDRIRSELQTLRGSTVDVDVDSAAAQSRIAELEARLRALGASEASPDVDVDTAGATAQLAAVNRQVSALDGRRADVNVDVDRNGTGFRGALFLTNQINGLLLAGAAIAPTLVPAFGAVALAAGGLASALASATVGVGGLVAAAVPSITAVSEAVKAQEQAEKSAATTAQSSARQRVQAAHAAEQAAERVADARRAADRAAEEGARRVEAAEQSLARTQEEAARSVLEAREQLARARERAAEQVVQAERRVTDSEAALSRAQESQRRAQEDLTRAREDATRALADLREQVDDLNRSEEGAEIGLIEAEQRLQELRDETSVTDIQRAELDLARARERLTEISQDASASDLDRRQALFDVEQAERRLTDAQREAEQLALERRKAELGLAEAEDRLSDVRRDKQRTTDELNEAERRGIDGSDQVVSAQRRLENATLAVAEATQSNQDAQAELARAQVEASRTVSDAQAELAQAQAESSRSIQDAEEGLALARQQAARANEDAARQVSRALEAQAQQAEMANMQAAEGTSAMRNLAFAMGALTPMQRQLMRGWQSLSEAFTQWSRALEPAIIPVFLQGMRLIEQILPLLTPIVEATAAAFGRLLARASDALEAPFWQSFFGWLAGTAGPQTEAFGQVLGNLAKGFAGLLMAFGPVAAQMTRGLVDLTARFAEWGATLGGNSGFQSFVEYVRQSWPQLKATLSALWDAFTSIVDALAPLGGPALIALEAMANVIASMPPSLLIAIAGGIFTMATALKLTGIAMAALRANPIILLISLIGALILQVIHAWQTSERFRDIVNGVLNAVTGFFRASFGAILSIVRGVWDWISRNWPTLLAILTGPIGLAVLFITKNWDKVKLHTHALRDAILAAWNKIRDGLGVAWQWIARNVIDRARAGFQGLRDRVVAVKDGIVGAWRSMRDQLRTVWEWIRDHVFAPFRRGFDRVWDKAKDIKDKVVGAFDTVAGTIEGAFNGITDGIKTALEWVFKQINKWMIRPINRLIGAVGIPEIPELQEEFHSGGWVRGRGEVPAVLLGDEAVLNRRAAQVLGKEGVDHLNKTGELLPMGGFGLPDWLKEGLKHGVMLGTKAATGQNLGDGLLAALRTVGNAGIDKLEGLIAHAGIGKDYSVAGTKKFWNGLLDWAIAGDEKLREDTAAKQHGSLPKPDGYRPPGAGTNSGNVLPPGTYRIGRGAAAHGYNARDLPAPIGTPIFAAAAGTVSKALRLATSYGIHAAIDHGNWNTLYAHMSQMYVRAGQKVPKGSMIGRVGSTGNSTGPHLHLEPDLARLYDSGGQLMPGLTLAFNGTGQRERVLNPAETRAYENGRGVTVENLHMQAWSDRFSLRQVEDELSFHGSH